MRISSLILALGLLVACGDEDDGATPKDAPKSGELPSKLKQALDALRASGVTLCKLTDRCYPEAIEEGWCSLPTSSFERDWPHEDTDVCWIPVYDKAAQKTLDALSCLSKSNADTEDCLQSCPDAEESWDCNEAASDAEDDCMDALTRAVGVALIEDADACDERLRPSDDEDDEVLSGP